MGFKSFNRLQGLTIEITKKFVGVVFFIRKPIEKMFCSSKDIREKLKLFFFKGFAYREFLEFDVQTGFKQKLLIASNFSESFIKIGAMVSEI